LVTLWNDEQCLGRGKAEIEELEKKKKKRESAEVMIGH